MSAFDTMGKVELRAACKEAGITGYGKLTVAAMREALANEAEPVVATPTKAAPKAKRKPQEERNGVKRPGPGKCLEVWQHLDLHGNMMPKDLKVVAAEKGWNENNASIELYAWRKFNGLGRVQAQPNAK